MNKKQEWVARLEQARRDQMIAITDQCRDIGISYMTYRRLLDPDIDIGILSYSTMRKIDAYLKNLGS